MTRNLAAAAEYPAEHAIADRLDGPVGREFAQISSDMGALVEAFTDDGSIDTHLVHMIRVGLERLELHGGLIAMQAELSLRARQIGSLADALDNDTARGAVERVQAELNQQCAEVTDLAKNVASA